MWLPCNIFSSSVKSQACHCICSQVGLANLTSWPLHHLSHVLQWNVIEPPLYWKCDDGEYLKAVTTLHHGATYCKVTWEGTLWEGRRVHIGGFSAWQLLNYFAICKIWKYSRSFLQKRLNPVLLLGLKPPLCSIVVMWPSQLNQLTSAFLAPATMSNKPGLPRMLMTPHLIH